MAKVALLIGVGNYEHSDYFKPLASAPKDVAAMQRILLNAQMGEFTEVIPLIDPDPMQMQEAIETLYRDLSKDDLVLLFFSGHGIKDDSGKLYFSTRVTRKTPKGELVKSTAVPARFVQEIMSNSRSRRQVMILDCCFSGAFDPALNAKADGSVDLQELGAEGRVVLTSSSSTEYSFEQQGSELSIYTRFLVEGIETGAADRDNDGKVSVRELHEYATKKVQETAPKMNPKIIVLKDEGFDVVFAKAQITDPKLKYRKEAERYSMRGEISPAGRTLLNTQRVRLRLTLEETQEIEDQVLQPFRERLKHLEDYRSAFVAEVERQYPLTLETANVLKDLQEILGLREEDVTQIEQDVTAQIANKSEADRQKLQGYEQTPIETLQAEVSVQSTLEQPKNMVLSSQKSEALASEAIEVFFSYSHKDEELRDELATHLVMMKRQGLIAAWHDRDIDAGDEWEAEILQHLNSARVILLLISNNFLASDFCYDKELLRAMERHESKEARVIPIIIKPCDWNGAPFGKLQALPKNAKPVTKWEDRDEAFVNVAQGIRKAVQQMATNS